MKKLLKGLLLSAGTVADASAGGTAYFYRRTMKRYHAKTERTMKMSGADWSRYMPLMEERKANMLAHPHEDVYITSEDGLKLHGVYFPGETESDRKKEKSDHHKEWRKCLSRGTGEQDRREPSGTGDYYP